MVYVRKIMRGHGLSPKRPQRIHINRAGKKSVQNWQYRLRQRIPRLERDGFVVMMEDEAFFIHDVITGRKYWSPRGQRINVPYTGSHKKITAYGSIARRRQAVLQDVREIRCVHVCRLPCGNAEAFREGDRGDRQGPASPLQARQGAATQEQEHQDHLFPKGLAVPERRGRMLVPWKARPAGVRTLQNIC